jgi:hypothetical protein
VATTGEHAALEFDTRVAADRRETAQPSDSLVDPAAVIVIHEPVCGGPRGRAEGLVREFRPRFHDAAVEASVATSP